MSVQANKWLHVPGDIPCIIDIDLKTVDTFGPWVRVRKFNFNQSNQARQLKALMHEHVLTRYHASKAGSCFVRDAKFLPLWVRERIAVLNIAEAGTFIPNVGKRWECLPSDGGPNRWYTLDVNCEGLHEVQRV